MSCPNSTESGCCCAFHHPGLLAFAPDPEAYEALLAAIRETPTLRVVSNACDGSMLCRCQDCVRQNAARGPHEIRQPWDPRPARRAA